MSMAELGPSFDIHTGGIDLIFPHHEDEIAQSEAATGQTFVRIWLHCAHLAMGGEKMAKRTGNIERPADVYARGYSPRALRYALLAAHYRAGLEFSDASLQAAAAAVERLSTVLAALDAYRQEGPDADDLVDLLASTRAAFTAGLDDDLNIAPALAAVFDLVREVNRRLAARTLSTADAARAAAFIRDLDRVLAVAEEKGRDPPWRRSWRRSWRPAVRPVPAATSPPPTACGTSSRRAASSSRTLVMASAGGGPRRSWMPDRPGPRGPRRDDERPRSGRPGPGGAGRPGRPSWQQRPGERPDREGADRPAPGTGPRSGPRLAPAQPPAVAAPRLTAPAVGSRRSPATGSTRRTTAGAAGRPAALGTARGTTAGPSFGAPAGPSAGPLTLAATRGTATRRRPAIRPGSAASEWSADRRLPRRRSTAPVRPAASL